MLQSSLGLMAVTQTRLPSGVIATPYGVAVGVTA